MKQRTGLQRCRRSPAVGRGPRNFGKPRNSSATAGILNDRTDKGEEEDLTLTAVTAMKINK